jgi:hypothetical protein
MPPVPTQIEADASAILGVLVEARDAASASGDVDQVSEELNGRLLQEKLGLPPVRINDAVALLELNGYVDVEQFLGTAPFEFGFVAATPLGRLEHQRAALAVDAPERASASAALPRHPVPIGSPYGFQEEDWEYVERERERRDVVKVVFGYQFESQHYDAETLREILERDFAAAVEEFNRSGGHEPVRLYLRLLSAGYGEHLFNEIAREVISADIAVFETSDLNPNVMLELGVALTWGIRVLPIKATGCPRPPSDISGQTWADYDYEKGAFVDGGHHDKLASMVRRVMTRKAAR